MSANQLKVFVNYRRADERIFVELLRTHFMYRYGRENVFMDFDSIPPFTEFEAFIRQKVCEADVVAMMIGPRWVELMQAKKAAGEPDYVLIELEEALAHNKVIAPICIMGAPVPIWNALPDPLRVIGRKNVLPIRDGLNLLDNINRIFDGFEGELERQGAARAVANVGSKAALTEMRDAAGRMNLDDVLDHFADAVTAHDLPQALVWLSQLRLSGQVIPASFNLDGREADLQERLRQEEERRRLREVADFQFKFIRRMIRVNDPPAQIVEAVLDAWKIEDSYIPDDLRPTIDPLMHPAQWVAHAPPKTTNVISTSLPPPFAWMPIPAGQVTLGGNEFGNGGYITQATTFDVLAFRIAKYPITNAQYQVFVDAKDGYRNPAWWDYSPDAKAWREANPKPQDRAFAGDDHPRANVSWYDAVAFCRWLSANTGEGITLPTDPQWQRAAQGDTGWAYPYGPEFDASRCNFNTTGTTPVTQYEGKGDSPFGVVEMSGNVWEWCLTLYETGSDDLSSTNARVLRGGSWYYGSADYFRVACRYGQSPDYRNGGGGFRLARSF